MVNAPGRERHDGYLGRAVRDRDGNIIYTRRVLKGKMAQLLAGEISVEDMDDEELARGQFKNSKGTFAGRPPALVPRQLHDRMMRELFKRADEKMASAMMDVVDTLIHLAKSPTVEPAVRLRAATYIYDRLRGKTPERLEVAQSEPWAQIIEEIGYDPASDAVIEGHVVPELPAGEPPAPPPTADVQDAAARRKARQSRRQSALATKKQTDQQRPRRGRQTS